MRQPFFVNRATLLLAIGRVRSTDIRPFVPVQAQPAQVLEQLAHERLGAASLVGILDAQDEPAARLARSQEIEQRRAGIAQMQMARRDWAQSG